MTDNRIMPSPGQWDETGTLFHDHGMGIVWDHTDALAAWERGDVAATLPASGWVPKPSEAAGMSYRQWIGRGR